MERQSLGSPISKLQIHGGGGLEKEKRRMSFVLPVPEPSSPSPRRTRKQRSLMRSRSKNDRSSHLIPPPPFTLICSSSLPLCSHEPSPVGN
ncbi:hypothetical protein AXF42_Ash000947 [Apostasia shenzhenica]|uniref:Uncharacterized protein n=1 Tax=Apostasia shenzhenica TaxID=1088818 RepID=A0A2I0ATI6_9ASPA|nr:hypothetical protein AXF42_Ash000947 [Apostasia shenzhenica]